MKSLILWPKISNSQINQFSKDCSEKGIGELGIVPNYIKFAILSDVDNLKLEKQDCVQHIPKRLPKIHDNDTKGKKMYHKQSSSVLKEIEKTTIVC